MNALTISCIAVAGAGVLIMLIGLPFFFHALGVKKKCNKTVYGRVVDHQYLKGGNTYITPLVEYYVDGERYIAYRHYKGVTKKKMVISKDKSMPDKDYLYVSDKDVLHIVRVGTMHSFGALAEDMWPVGSELPVLYNPQKPKQAFVEKVVVVSQIAGIVLVCVGCGVMLLAGIIFCLLA